MQVQFKGSDAGAGRQVAGVTYFPGDVADLPAADARLMIALGFAMAYTAPLTEGRIAVLEVEHRDTFGSKRKR